MVVTTPPGATLDDLLMVKEKAELIGGRIVYIMPHGDYPGEVAFEIAVSLRTHATRTGIGKARTDGVGFALPSPLTSGRLSFSPDASFTTGPAPARNMRFVPGGPTFAVEVRSENDYGPKAERDMAEKRADYFEAGTPAVWDVDPLAETVTLYRAADPLTPVVFRRGDTADAEPAVPGWRVAVDELFG